LDQGWDPPAEVLLKRRLSTAGIRRVGRLRGVGDPMGMGRRKVKVKWTPSNEVREEWRTRRREKCELL
jgi:hypothetical protein